MKKISIVLFMIVFVYMLFPVSVFAQEDDIPLKPIPINYKLLDLNGTWNYKTTKPSVSGSCPGGNALAGTAVITQNGMEVTLKYTSGTRCRPKAVCVYSGTLDEENNLNLANSVKVDNEGGEVSSAIHLMVFNNELASGNGTNHYVHPKGFECRWNMDVTFTRKLEKEDKKKKK